MNKKLSALAVAGVCVAPAAMAQTTNPVVLYGRAYAMLESVEATGGASPVVRRNRVTDEASLLGVRGTEDLGGGLKAFFQLETGFKLDQNDTTFAARNSAVGLQGGWGSILMGRWDTPLKVAVGAVDPFGDLTLGGLTDAMNGSGVNGVTGQFDIRQINNVQYWSPSWAGVAVRLSYAANEGRTATLNPRSNGASITYTGGPLYVGYAWHELKDTVFSGTIVPPKQNENTVFGTFAFGPIKLGAVYGKIKRDNFSDQKSWLGTGTWTLGNNQLIYVHQDAKDGGPTTGTAIQPHCKVDAVGWQYNFSRRTFFLAQYVRIDNNDTSTCNMGANVGGITIAAGQDPRGFALGLRHVF